MSNPVAKGPWKIALGNIRWDSHLAQPVDTSAYAKNFTAKSTVSSDGKFIVINELDYGTPKDPQYSFEFEMRDLYFKTWMRRVSKDDAVAFYVRADLNVYVNGNYYKIPDLWLLMDVHNGGYGTRIVSNWRTYSMVECWNAGQSTTLYGYRDGDKNQPWMLTLKTVKDDSGQVYIDMDENLPVYVKDSAPRYDVEFDYMLARKRFDTTWDYEINRLFLGVTKSEYVVCDPIPQDTLHATVIVAHDAKPESIAPEYVSTAVLRNQFTQPLAMKSSDYSHAYAEAIAVSDTWTHTFTETVSVAFKAGIPVLGESTITGTFTNTFTFTRGVTTTHTETKTYTIPGQMVSVPGETNLAIETTWNRSLKSGSMTAYCDLGATAKAKVVTPTSTRNVTSTWKNVVDQLPMRSIQIDPILEGVTHAGVFTFMDLGFESSTGSVGEVIIKEWEPEPEPKPDPSAFAAPILVDAAAESTYGTTITMQAKVTDSPDLVEVVAYAGGSSKPITDHVWGSSTAEITLQGITVQQSAVGKVECYLRTKGKDGTVKQSEVKTVVTKTRPL